MLRKLGFKLDKAQTKLTSSKNTGKLRQHVTKLLALSGVAARNCLSCGCSHPHGLAQRTALRDRALCDFQENMPLVVLANVGGADFHYGKSAKSAAEKGNCSSSSMQQRMGVMV